MKLLVFAHTPPPHHGQSYMVQVMLNGLGGDCRKRKRREESGAKEVPAAGKRGDGGGQVSAKVFPRVKCYHVNARLSRELEDIGDLRLGKFFLLLGYCLQAIWCRFRYGIHTFYYIPAPGKRSALLRDWLVMLLCRPFFKRTVLHWHAAGLAKWLETSVQIRTRAVTYRLLKSVDLSIVLSKYNRADAEKLFSRHIKVVTNGIPDPCPEFEKEVLPRRQARFRAHKKFATGAELSAEEKRQTPEPGVIQVVFLAHCTREKGVFDTSEGILTANQLLRQRGSPLKFRLDVAGNFVTPAERLDFQQILAQPGNAEQIQYLGFVSGQQKRQLLLQADIFCFPTYYQNENQPVNLIEAMAYGLPILTTRWRSIPELFPASYPGLVGIRSPHEVAEALIALLKCETGEGFRQCFLENFTLERHLGGLTEAFLSVENPPAAAPTGTEPIAPHT